MDLYKLWALDVQFPHSFSLCMLIIPKGKLLVRVASNFEIEFFFFFLESLLMNYSGGSTFYVFVLEIIKLALDL